MRLKIRGGTVQHGDSGYSDRRHPSIREMEDIAWVLRTDPSRKQIGFVQAGKLAPKDRYVLPDDDDWS